MSTPGNTAKLGTAHSNIQTAQSNPSLVGANLQCISPHATELALYPLCQPGIISNRKYNLKHGKRYNFLFPAFMCFLTVINFMSLEQNNTRNKN